MEKNKNYIFTINDYQSLPDFSDTLNIDYVIYQEEISPLIGIPYIEGYIEFNCFMEIIDLKKLPIVGFATAHFEPRRGTQQEAITYCRKPFTRKPNTRPVEYGQPSTEKIYYKNGFVGFS